MFINFLVQTLQCTEALILQFFSPCKYEKKITDHKVQISDLNSFIFIWKTHFLNFTYCTCFPELSQAETVMRNGQKFLAFSLKLAQPFINTLFLLSRTKKQVTHTLKHFSHCKSKQSEQQNTIVEEIMCILSVFLSEQTSFLFLIFINYYNQKVKKLVICGSLL